MTEGQRTMKVVYTIVERERDGKKFWMRLGVAYPNRDGSLNVHLDAVPTNGKLQIRDYKPLEERGHGDRQDSSFEMGERALAHA